LFCFKFVEFEKLPSAKLKANKCRKQSFLRSARALAHWRAQHPGADKKYDRLLVKKKDKKGLQLR
jgi:hypothetical protein